MDWSRTRGYDAHSFCFAKKMSKLLRRELPHLREKEETVASKKLAPMFVSQFSSSHPHFDQIRTWLNHLQRGGAKKRFWYCVGPNYLWSSSLPATQGHSGRYQIDLRCKTTWNYQMTSPSAKTTLEAVTTCTTLHVQDVSQVDKTQRKGGKQCSFTARTLADGVRLDVNSTSH